MKTLLLTGSNGFIGSNLLPFLQDYYILPFDLQDGQDIREDIIPTADYVVHLAGIADLHDYSLGPSDYWSTNVYGTERILAANPKARSIIASSSCVKEAYRSPYGASKLAAETIPHDNSLHLRITTVFGENSREGMFFERLRAGTLEYTTNHVRDFLYVKDLCKIICYLLETEDRGTVDVGTGIGTKVSSLAPHLPIREGKDYEMQDNTSSIPWPGCRSIEDFIDGQETKATSAEGAGEEEGPIEL